MLSDTHPEVEKVQIELIRKMSVAERIARMRSLTTMVISLSRRAIARANPQLSQQEVDLMWVELNYGEKIADQLRNYLKDKLPCNRQTQ